MEKTYIVHDAPALRDAANFISMIDLEPFGFPGQFEQVWLRQDDRDVFELCCIPFRACGLALNDTVRVTRDATLVYELVTRSGKRNLRVLLAEGRGRLQKDGGGRIEDICHSLGLLYEWSGYRHIAIDVPGDSEIAALLSCVVNEEEKFRAEWEWADVEEFRPGG